MFEELQKLMKPHTDKIVQEAVEAAVEAAVQEQTVTDIESMITRFGMALEEACDAVGMTVEEFNRVKENIKKKEEDFAKEEKENTTD